MQLITYNFKKRVNSTKVPLESNKIGEYTVTMLQPTNLLNPQLELSSENVPKFFYAELLGSYYFVNDITYMSNNKYAVSLEYDKLATHKAGILETFAYIQYASSGYDLNIRDSRIGASNETEGRSVTQDLSGFGGLGGSGTYFLTVVSEDMGSYTTTYAMTRAQAGALAQMLTTTSDWVMQLSEWWFNPFEAIVEFYWIPVDISSYYVMTGSTIKIGSYDTGLSANILGDITSATTKEITINWKYTDFRNVQPFTTATFYFPYVGLHEINISDWYGHEKLKYVYGIDAYSGDISVILMRGDYPVQTLSGNCKTTMPIGQVQSRAGDIVKAGVGIVGAGLSIATGSIWGAVTVAGMAISGTINQRESMSNGAFTSRAGELQSQKVKLTLIVKSSTVEPASLALVKGLPVMRRAQIGDFNGYLQTVDASVSLSAPLEVINAINSALDGGVYIE